MRKRTAYIAIEGPIGAGKSSLVSLLGRKFGVDPVYEPLAENPFLEMFYKNQKDYAFQTQVAFLVSRFKQLSALTQTDLFNQYIFCDYIFERDLIFAGLNLNESELRLYTDIYRLMARSVPKPDLVVYLQADTATLMRRIKARGRDMERGVPEEYIERVSKAFNGFFFDYREGPLLIINTNNIDFVANEADLDKLTAKITGEVKGQEFFNPLGSVFGRPGR
ncbi:MAG: deoxynucleoside kinase [Nitrospinae bacterium]|nr:deoxynucleoside kinase [Nitrospinota bacterium]